MLSSTSCPGSPVEHTLEVLQTRLLKAEEETQKLSTQVMNYGFKRVPAEKLDVDTIKTVQKDSKMFHLLKEVNNNSNKIMVSRLCKMESTIESLRSGMKSLELEKNRTTSEVLQEKQQIQEEYQKELQRKKSEICKYKNTIKTFENAKTSLEKQIEKLKKEVIKRIDVEKSIQREIEDKNKELEVYRDKSDKTSQELMVERNTHKNLMVDHEALLLRMSEIEKKVNGEEDKVEILNKQCLDLNNDAILARNEFEKEFNTRLKLEDLLSLQEKDYETANENMAAIVKENLIFKQKLKSLKTLNNSLESKFEKIQHSLEMSLKENKKLKGSLKVAVVDQQALVSQAKNLVNREQYKSQQVLKEHDLLLDNAKMSMSNEVNQMKEKYEFMEKQNVTDKSELHRIQEHYHKSEAQYKTLELKFDSDIALLNKEKKSLEDLNKNLTLSLANTKSNMQLQIENILNEKDALAQETVLLREKLFSNENDNKKLEQQLVLCKEKLSWRNIKEISQQNIEKKLEEMMIEKSKYAYEKGSLQTTIHQLESLLADHKVTEEQLKSIKLEKKSLEEALMKCETQIHLKNEEQRSSLEKIKHCDFELKKIEGESLKKSRCIDDLIAARDKSLDENKKLLEYISTLKDTYEQKINHLQDTVVMYREEKNNYGDTVQSIMNNNEQLQQQVEELLVDLGKKDTQLQYTMKETNNQNDEMAVLKQELLQNESHAKSVKFIKNKFDSLQTDHDQLLKDLIMFEEDQAASREAILKLRSECKKKDAKIKNMLNLRNENKESVAKQNEDLINTLNQQHKKEINRCKLQLSNSKKIYKEKEKTLEEQVKLLSKQLDVLERDKQVYVEKNENQQSLLKSFMEQVSELQNEMTSIAETQNETTLRLRDKEVSLEKEKSKRKSVESKYKMMLRQKANEKIQYARSPLSNKQNIENKNIAGTANTIDSYEMENSDTVGSHELAMSALQIEHIMLGNRHNRRLKEKNQKQ